MTHIYVNCLSVSLLQMNRKEMNVWGICEGNYNFWLSESVWVYANAKKNLKTESEMEQIHM